MVVLHTAPLCDMCVPSACACVRFVYGVFARWRVCGLSLDARCVLCRLSVCALHVLCMLSVWCLCVLCEVSVRYQSVLGVTYVC